MNRKALGRGLGALLSSDRTIDLGAVAARLLGGAGDSALPGHVRILPKGGSGFNGADATFLGPKFASVGLGDGKPPADLFRPNDLPTAADEQREEFRKKLNDRFAKSRKSAATAADRLVRSSYIVSSRPSIISPGLCSRRIRARVSNSSVTPSSA